jgi:phenylalanyl-tRNA synthetase beta chain
MQIVGPEDLPVATLADVVRAAAGPLLDDLRWFDEFRGSQLPEGHRSVGFRLRLQDPERQLSDEDAERVLRAVTEGVAAVGASLRT